MTESHPPVIDYEGSDYQTSFWEQGGRAYEDLTEAIALKRLLPSSGKLMLELGAGAGRNTPRFGMYERVVVMDYSRTQLEQAQDRLGRSERYIYAAADVYRLPFVDGLFDGAVMIRVLHHMADAPAALKEIRRALGTGGTFILEYANKRNTKAVLRWMFGRQKWNPFERQPVEFEKLNFDFHPKTIRAWLRQASYHYERALTVSHFRVGWLKRHVSPKLLAALDGALQWTGAFCQYTPSVFTKSRAIGDPAPAQKGFFRCPACGSVGLNEKKDAVVCLSCKRSYELRDGIYDFRVK